MAFLLDLGGKEVGMTPGSCLSRRGSPHCCLRCRRCWQRRSTAQSPCDLDGAVPTAMVSSSGCHTYSLSSLYFLFNSHHLVRKVTRANYITLASHLICGPCSCGPQGAVQWEASVMIRGQGERTLQDSWRTTSCWRTLCL